MTVTSLPAAGASQWTLVAPPEVGSARRLVVLSSRPNFGALRAAEAMEELIPVSEAHGATPESVQAELAAPRLRLDGLRLGPDADQGCESDGGPDSDDDSDSGCDSEIDGGTPESEIRSDLKAALALLRRPDLPERR